MKPIVSIAMATFNGARYLQAQLESFSTQTLLPDELVVCDDCSSDATVEIVERFKLASPFEVIIHRNEANLGYIQNFAKALSLCRGDVVFLSDQDDVWYDQKIERVLAAFQSDPDAMVVLNDQLIVDAELNSSGVTKVANMKRLGIPQKDFVTGCCSAHRRDWQSIVLPIPDGAVTHDAWINGIAQRLAAAILLPDVLQLYRRHGANASDNLISSGKPGSPLRRFRRYHPYGLKEKLEHLIVHKAAIVKRLGEARLDLERMGFALAADDARARLSRYLWLQRFILRMLSGVSRITRLSI
ncbi:glycosyltransferase family 2 protein [Sphingosinicella rhizophila]|uniref:Glycosyltransferase family 2 protein n=1 Tax=Sphingosinicella rhizophila TaxID=3050082 RepID=A0ABU3Q3M0_9SPHN|nr:glycosyltransferase family 2 protein [Sphingosinicella sp. GR2756]MDT9598011.1 glycosyltransferase family 2 protein [Sphingosinicella sp. GR2756]